MRVCPAERSAATSLVTSESMSSPEPMPVELMVDMVEILSGRHVEKRATPLIQVAPHLQRLFTRHLADDVAGGSLAHGDHHGVGVGVDTEFQVSAVGTKEIAHLLRDRGHALPLLDLGNRRGSGMRSGHRGGARVCDWLWGRRAGYRTNGLGIHVASSK